MQYACVSHIPVQGRVQTNTQRSRGYCNAEESSGAFKLTLTLFPPQKITVAPSYLRALASDLSNSVMICQTYRSLTL